MAYATAVDMVTSFGEEELIRLTDVDAVPTGAVVTARVQRALDDASAMLDGYLAGRYSVPLASVPGVVKMHALGVARYFLQRVNPDDRAIRDYEAAVRYMERVASGQIALMPPAQASAAAPASSTGAVVFAPGSKIFGREV